MHPIRIFRHVLCEGPGYLGQFLDREGAAWELVCLDEGIPVPLDLDGVSGLVFMGGNMSVNDPLDWIAQELELIRRAFVRRVPMMGICFGAQLVSKALGGEVAPSPFGMEIGWHPVRRVPGVAAPEWLADLPGEIDCFHWHGETFHAPPAACRLFENRCFPHQAFALGDHLGMQFHLEMTEEMVLGWLEHFGAKLDPAARCTQSAAEITRDLPRRIERLHRGADALYGRWLERLRRRWSG
jgi:GMP synthase-like glutamine amidotransferase